jgi:hypothetical protein
MATRGNIGIVNQDGSITGIYVHFDAYPAYVGKTLLNCYTDTDIVNKLIDLGDLSSIGEDLYATGHTWEVPIEGVCVAYGRDRGEKDVESKRFNSESEYKMNGKGVDYQYLFKDNKWYYRKVSGPGSFAELTAEICKMY